MVAKQFGSFQRKGFAENISRNVYPNGCLLEVIGSPLPAIICKGNLVKSGKNTLYKCIRSSCCKIMSVDFHKNEEANGNTFADRKHGS